jgi:hypothetical protein
VPESLRAWSNEITVVLVRPGENVRIETKRGPYGVRGVAPTDPYQEVRLAMVPYAPAVVGWGETECVIHGLGPARFRTPTGLRAETLRRVMRGHKDDWKVWEEARIALDRGPVYVRIERVPHYDRTRLAATGVRGSAEATARNPRVNVPVNASRTTVDAPVGEAARLRPTEMDTAGTVVMDNVEEEHRGSD